MSNTLNAALVIRNRAPSVCPVPCTHQVFTWASVILGLLAKVALSADARYFCLWKRFSSSQICIRVNEVRGFFRFGGVRFWYGWPMRRVGKAAYPGPNGKVTAGWGTRLELGEGRRRSLLRPTYESLISGRLLLIQMKCSIKA